MKRLHFILLALIFYCPSFSQEVPAHTEQQLENQADADQAETEDDSYLQDLEHFKKHRLNINTADADELKQLRLISDLQIANLISYRRLFGNLVSLYELQAVPAWDVVTIKKILPFITAETSFSLAGQAKRFRSGEHTVVLRMTQVLEPSTGFADSNGPPEYAGSPQRIFLRYRYQYKNLLQFGVVGDKDAGEQFFRGAQKKGFDFYSFHLFARKLGIVQAVALGDFTVNMGQGLIQWQGLAFKKSAEVMGIKRQSAVLRPYNSAGEFYFQRGAGITVKKGRVEATAFFSQRKLNANVVEDAAGNETHVSSFLTSGYNRTANELADRNKLGQTSFGGNVLYRGNRWHAGLNGVAYQFSLPVQKREEPYNLYAVSGKSWHNFSADYSYTYKNFHFFGEAATGKNNRMAFINGLLISVDPKVDLAVLYRSIDKAYQSLNGNSFTENTLLTNEKGLYGGITIRPATGWKIDAYCDFYKFPWLKYLVDAPSTGRDYLVQLTYTPNRQLEVYTRYRNESKQANQAENVSVTNLLVVLPRQGWRTHISYKLSSAITLRNRVELLWYDKKGQAGENGFLSFLDIIYKPMLRPFSATLRLQYFETQGYKSRIYAYENDVLYSYSIPAFADRGYRYYLVLNVDAGKKLSFWARWAQTVYANRQTIGSGGDEILQHRKTELKLQARLLF